MASHNKRALLALETPDTTESSSSSASEDSDVDVDDEQAEAQQHGEIQVEFEARTAEACDFHGVKALLHKLFEVGGPAAMSGEGAVSLSELADLVINQRSVGSVITQSRRQQDAEDEDDDEDDDGNDVFGVTTVVRVSGSGPQQPGALGRSVAAFLLACCSDKDRPKLKALLEREGAAVGLIVSERIMNIPPQISVPLYETLFNEIRKAKAKNFPFDFTHYLLVSRRHRFNDDKDSPASLENGIGFSQVFVNAEEEVVEGLSEEVLEVKAQEQQQQQAPNAEAGDDGEAASSSFNNKFVDLSNSEFETTARIMVLDANKSELMVDALKREFPLPP